MGLYYGRKLGTHMLKRMQAKVADTFKPHMRSGTHQNKKDNQAGDREIHAHGAGQRIGE